MMVFDDYMAEVLSILSEKGFEEDIFPEDIKDNYDAGDDPENAAIMFLERLDDYSDDNV
jgi:hypothetical protein